MRAENITARGVFSSSDITHQWEEYRASAYETTRRTILVPGLGRYDRARICHPPSPFALTRTLPFERLTGEVGDEREEEETVLLPE